MQEGASPFILICEKDFLSPLPCVQRTREKRSPNLGASGGVEGVRYVIKVAGKSPGSCEMLAPQPGYRSYVRSFLKFIIRMEVTRA